MRSAILSFTGFPAENIVSVTWDSIVQTSTNLGGKRMRASAASALKVELSILRESFLFISLVGALESLRNSYTELSAVLEKINNSITDDPTMSFHLSPKRLRVQIRLLGIVEFKALSKELRNMSIA